MEAGAECAAVGFRIERADAELRKRQPFTAANDQSRSKSFRRQSECRCKIAGEGLDGFWNGFEGPAQNRSSIRGVEKRSRHGARLFAAAAEHADKFLDPGFAADRE